VRATRPVRQLLHLLEDAHRFRKSRVRRSDDAREAQRAFVENEAGLRGR
jgi:hypothetical protein